MSKNDDLDVVVGMGLLLGISLAVSAVAFIGMCLIVKWIFF